MIGHLRAAPAPGPGRPDRNPLAGVRPLILESLVTDLVRGRECDDVAWLLRQETSAGANALFAAQEAAGATGDFVADLHRAIGCAGHLPAGPARLGRECEHALSLGSLAATGGGIGPELLWRLVDRGAWSIRQARAYAEGVPDPRERAEALLVLPAHDVADAVLAAAGRIEQPDARTGPLRALLRHEPDPELLRKVLRRAPALLERPAFWQLIGDVSGLLGPDLTREALAQATGEGVAPLVRTRMAAHLPADERVAFAERLLAELAEVTEPITLAAGYLALIELVDSDHPAIDAVRDRVLGSTDRHGREALRMILPSLPPAVQEDIIAVLRDRPDAVGGPRFAELAAGADPAVLPLIVDWIRSVHGDDRVLLIHRLAQITPYAGEPLRTELVAEVMRDVERRPVPPAELWSVPELEWIAPRLSTAQIEAALTVVRRVPYVVDRAVDLTRLARVADEAVADEALGVIERLPDAADRTRLLNELAPALDGPRLDRALRAARSLHDGAGAAGSLPAMMAAMSPAGRRQAFAWLLEQTADRLDAWRVIGFLDRVDDLPPDDLRRLAATTENPQLRTRALAAAGDRAEAHAAARALDPAWRCAELTYLARRAAPAERAALLAEAEDAATACADPLRAALLLTTLVPLAAEPERDRLTRAALDRPVREGNTIIPRLAPAMPLALARALLAGLSWSWFPTPDGVEAPHLGIQLGERDRDAAVAALLRRCAAEDDAGWVERSLATRRRPATSWELAELAAAQPTAGPMPGRALAALAERPPEFAATPPGAWYETTGWTTSASDARQYVLSTIVTRLDPADAEPHLERLPEPVWRLRALLAICATAATPALAGRAVDAALRIDSPDRRAAGVAELATVLARHPAAISEAGRATLVDFLASRNRAEGLPVCLAAGPLWTLWGGGEAAADEVFDAVRRVTRWWP